MPELETDYLVVGAGASGMAFTDALLSNSDARVVLVDRRHSPGGHWLDAYPFVRLHQPSACYGVSSRPLGEDRIDQSGINAGFYERSTSAEISDYFGRVLEDFRDSGRVEFLGMSDYQGHDSGGYHVRSLLTGADTTIRARKLVDASYLASQIPSRHTPPFAIDPDARVLAPNDLVHLDEPPHGFTVIGAGKTAMDTCNWLLDVGVDPDRIRWIRPRDAWLFNRASTQPLDLVGSFMTMQAGWVQECANATDGEDFGRRLEEHGTFLRTDSAVAPRLFRGATISTTELEALRCLERTVRMGKVRRLGSTRLVLDDGELACEPGEVFVDCTAAGVPATATRPVFETGRITVQFVTIGFVPWSAATIGFVEATRSDDTDKNRLCPTLAFSGDIADVFSVAYNGMTGTLARASEPDIAAWNDGCRLNPAQAASAHLDDPAVVAAYTCIAENVGPALQNLASRLGPAG
jgi:hypothetical protein